MQKNGKRRGREWLTQVPLSGKRENFRENSIKKERKRRMQIDLVGSQQTNGNTCVKNTTKDDSQRHAWSSRLPGMLFQETREKTRTKQIQQKKDFYA